MIDINGKSYEFKYSLRAMFIWEEVTGRPFEVKTLLDTYILAYACIVANPDNPALEFSELIDYADQYPEVMDEFNKYLNEEMKRRETLSAGKKKVTRKKVKN
jgi:hypothetical protein